MLIGDTQTFAIECYHEPLPNETRRVFGRMCIWTSDRRLGDITEPACMLNVTEGHLQALLGRIASLEDPALCELGDRDAFEFLNQALYVDEERSNEQVFIDVRRFSRFDFLTHGGESFDHTKSFVVSDGDYVRLLFEDDQNCFASSRIARDTFVLTIQSFLAWVAEEGRR
jgi:Immunity protein 42